MKKAYAFCAFAGAGGSLFGYDIGVISGVLEMAEFKALFHMNDWSKGFVVTAYIVGCCLGALASGLIADLFSRKTAIRLACITFICGGTLQVGSINVA